VYVLLYCVNITFASTPRRKEEEEEEDSVVIIKMTTTMTANIQSGDKTEDFFILLVVVLVLVVHDEASCRCSASSGLDDEVQVGVGTIFLFIVEQTTISFRALCFLIFLSLDSYIMTSVGG